MTRVEKFKQFATSKSIVNPDVLLEGIVIINPTNYLSFKNISVEYLLNHNN